MSQARTQQNSAATISGHPKRSRYIAFRLTNEEFQLIEKAATASGDNPNSWCRKRALSASKGPNLATQDNLNHPELAILRFLVGHGFKLLLSPDDAATWTRLTTQADQRSHEIVAEPDHQRFQFLKSNGTPEVGISEFKTLAVVEEEHIQTVLQACDGNMSKAARILGRDKSQFGKLCRSKGWAKNQTPHPTRQKATRSSRSDHVAIGKTP
jgi:DNA-binding protein Fis